MKALNKYFTGLLVAGIILTGCVSSGHKVPQDTKEFAKTSAMITLENKQSGGSGVILRSTANKSWVLTNKHVCQLIQNGGLVTTEQGSYPVASYRPYRKHDLCLVEVMVNLHVNTYLAEKPPELYSQAVIAGHPALLPTMVTRGHFTKKMNISIMVDVLDCDGQEEGDDAVFCAMFGKKPVILTLEAQPTTATIMAGSSGSGVFNTKGEITGLVFAGSQGLSYGFLVPYEYVSDFLHNLDRYPPQIPNRSGKAKSLFADIKKIENYCQVNKDKCRGMNNSGIYHDN